MPPEVCTEIFPECACFGTVATIVRADECVIFARTPPNFSHIGELRFAPVIVTRVPAVPRSGETEVMRGASLSVAPACVPAEPEAVGVDVLAAGVGATF